MAKTLAFIAWLVTDPVTGSMSTVYTENPDDCIAVGDRNAEAIRQGGYLVDVFCLYTHAPATSMRPIARPAE